MSCNCLSHSIAQFWHAVEDVQDTKSNEKLEDTIPENQLLLYSLSTTFDLLRSNSPPWLSSIPPRLFPSSTFQLNRSEILIHVSSYSNYHMIIKLSPPGRWALPHQTHKTTFNKSKDKQYFPACKSFKAYLPTAECLA